MISTVLICLGKDASAGDAGSGGRAGEFLQYGTSVRSLGMGRCHFGIANSAAAVLHNPAGLMRTPQLYDAYLMFCEPLLASTYSATAFSVSRFGDSSGATRKGFRYAFGLGAINCHSSGYEIRSYEDQLLGTMGFSQSALIGAFANRWNNEIFIADFGLSAKYLYFDASQDRKIDDSWANLRTHTNLTFDFAMEIQFVHVWPLWRSDLRERLPLRFGIIIHNINTPSIGHTENEGDVIPRIIRIGGSYAFPVSTFNDLLFAAEVAWRNPHSRAPSCHFGLEYQLDSSDVCLYPRVGALYQSGDKIKPTIGFGFTFDLTDNLHSRFEFAYTFNQYLDDELQVSMNLWFGADRKTRHYYDDSLVACYISELGSSIEALGTFPEYDRAGQREEDSSVAIVAARCLANTLDTPRDSIYYEFIGDLAQALGYASGAHGDLRAGNFQNAYDKANKADTHFTKAAAKENVKHDDSLVWVRVNLISAMDPARPGNSRQLIQSVITKLDAIDNTDTSPTVRFLWGVTYRIKADNDAANAAKYLDSALSYFRPLVDGNESAEGSLWMLALINEAICWIEKRAAASGETKTSPRIDTVINKLRNRQPQHTWRPDPTYLPFPSIKKFNASDLAEIMIGDLYQAIGQRDSAMGAYARAIRYYPHGGSVAARKIKERLDSMINPTPKKMEESDMMTREDNE